MGVFLPFALGAGLWLYFQPALDSVEYLSRMVFVPSVFLKFTLTAQSRRATIEACPAQFRGALKRNTRVS